MVSVVIPLYNKEKQVGRTLESVLAQTFQDFEVVIVDDGSTDGSAKVVKTFDDPRIRLIRQANAGVSAARNRGIDAARYDYIALLDADDLWHEDYLLAVSKLIEKYPDCGVYGFRYQFQDEFGKITPCIINNLPFDSEDGIISNYFHVASTSGAPLWTSAVVASKELLLKTGGFPTEVTSGEDLLTWAKLACVSNVAYLNHVCATYYTPTTGPTGAVPKDLESTKDFVGTELQKLAKEFPHKGVDEYIAFWYKMRAAINIRRRNRMAAFRCAAKSIRFRPTFLKAWIIMGLSVMPGFVIKKFMGR